MGSIAANTLLVIILLNNVPIIDTTMGIKTNFDIININCLILCYKSNWVDDILRRLCNCFVEVDSIISTNRKN